MRAKLSLLFLTFSVLAFGQYTDSRSFQIDWSEKQTAIHSGYQLTFEENIAPHDQLPLYGMRINIPVKGKLKATLSNVVTESAPASNLNIASDYKVTSYVTSERHSYYANINIVPLRATEKGVIKILRATINIEVSPLENDGRRGPTFKENSVLANGTFYKMQVSETGIYSMTAQELADGLGLTVGDLNRDRLQLYVGQPGRLPEAVDAQRVDDLMEIPIEITGSGTNLAPTDQIRFFANGADRWVYDLEEGQYYFDKNPYSSNAYVYLRIDGSDGLRVQSMNEPSSVMYQSDTYDYLQRYESDQVNLLGINGQTEGTGQRWFGDFFGSDNEQDMTGKFDFRGIVTSEPAVITYEMAARSSSSTSSNLQVDDEVITNTYGSTALDNPESSVAKADKGSLVKTLSPSTSLKLTYNKSTSSDQAWLDYIEIIATRSVGSYGSQTIITDRKSVDEPNAEFIGNISSAIAVWNVTELDNVQSVSDYADGWKYMTNDKLQTFIAAEEYLSPEFVGEVPNQNLHSIQELDMVIVHAAAFTDESVRLAEHRGSHDGLTVATVDVQQIYHEFSGGKLDPTAIRDFCKMLHDRSPNFRYLLLMGDASYDYRTLMSNLPDHNFVPCYQTKESLHPIYGFPSDDYFGLLSDDEGASTVLAGDLDIAVGRIPVSDPEQARHIVDKIITYDAGPNRYGDWRLSISFAADDEDSNTHIDDSDGLAKLIESSDPIYNQQKVYFDAFEQISTPGGDRYYDASNAINTSMQNGQLLLNYLGHGGPSGWAQERVLKNTDIDTWNNADQLPILMTATCTFTGYDDPAVVSSGEYAIRKKNGGVVALLTTTRAVFANQNEALARAMLKTIFKLDDNGEARTLGEIMSAGKNTLTSDSRNLRKFALIGDPSMKIAIPTQHVATRTINGQDIASGELDTLRALEEVTITGSVTDANGSVLTDFNGTVYPTIFDKKSTLETRQNDPGSFKKSFEVYKNILFKGAATVKNGEFTFSFVLPKDINYQYGLGRVSYYADNGVDLDAAGYFHDLVIGGSSDQVVTDDVGPEIELYINDTLFVDGGICNEDAMLLVYLSDDLGINTSGNSIGHDLTATIDGDEVYVLNNFYKANIDDPRSGIARFPLNGLTPGLHTAAVKAWDLANNSSTATITFEVLEGGTVKVHDVFIYPNPLLTLTDGTIVFEHDLVGQSLLLMVDIYNTTGQYITNGSYQFFATGNRVELPLSEIGIQKIDEMPAGMYFYKIKLQVDELDTFRESDFEKLIKAR